MFRKLRAMAKAVRVLGGTASYGRVKALRDQTLQQLAELAEQRQILEHTMRPKYTEAQYHNSLARIQADERRLAAKFDRYDAQLREISAGIERRSLELESNANPDEPGHAPLDHGELLGFRDSDELQDAMALAAKAGINPTQSRYHYQFLLEAYGQSAVTELAKLIRNGHFEHRFPDDTIESALDQLTDDEDEADHDQPEDPEPYVSPPLTADAAGICPLCSREILESRETGAWDGIGEDGTPTGGAQYVARCPDCSVTLRSAGPYGAGVKSLRWALNADDVL